MLSRTPSFGARLELHECEDESAGPLASLIVREPRALTAVRAYSKLTDASRTQSRKVA